MGQGGTITIAGTAVEINDGERPANGVPVYLTVINNGTYLDHTRTSRTGVYLLAYETGISFSGPVYIYCEPPYRCRAIVVETLHKVGNLWRKSLDESLIVAQMPPAGASLTTEQVEWHIAALWETAIIKRISGIAPSLGSLQEDSALLLGQSPNIGPVEAHRLLQTAWKNVEDGALGQHVDILMGVTESVLELYIGKFGPSNDLTPLTYEGYSRAVPKKVKDNARQLFLKANAHFDAGRYRLAEALYQQALEYWAHPLMWYNLAVVQLLLKRHSLAYKSLSQALRHGSQPFGEKKYAEARRLLASLSGMVAVLEVSCFEPGARVTLDGKVLFQGPGTFTSVLTEGTYLLVATKAGFSSTFKQVVLNPGERARVTLTFQSEHLAFAPLKVSAVAITDGAVAITGGAGIIAGGLIHWRSNRKYSSAIAYGLYSVGAAGLTIGLVQLWRSRANRQRARQRTAISPMVAPGTTGVWVRVQF
ncbi:MAG: tetratricopeptide repeat protein [Proteobacteria bacterium]|nr:tetratricopeptide repeat protein [Pseudomonadota bacterium]